jgi:hypothetical protein
MIGYDYVIILIATRRMSLGPRIDGRGIDIASKHVTAELGNIRPDHLRQESVQTFVTKKLNPGLSR